MSGTQISTLAGPRARRGAPLLPFTDPAFQELSRFLRSIASGGEGPPFRKLVLPRSRLGGGGAQ
jgi:hypothetical protein